MTSFRRLLCYYVTMLLCYDYYYIIAEEGYSILTETSLQKVFLVSDNNFISYYHA